MHRMVLLAMLVLFSAVCSVAQPRVGGITCSTSTFSGPYFWLLSGVFASGNQVIPATEIARIASDGRGNFSGNAQTVAGGNRGQYSVSGTYSIQENCTGSFTLRYDSQAPVQATFQIVDGGASAVIAFSQANAVFTGRIFRQSANASTSCGNGSISGTYGYLLTGAAGSTPFADSGSVTSDGNGTLAVRSTVNLGGAVSSRIGTGSYSVGGTCQGAARIVDQSGNTVDYIFGIVLDSQLILFISATPGTTVSGTANAQSVAAPQAVVNGASFASMRLAPGLLFSIFGNNLSQQSVSADRLPLPVSLGSTQVLIDGSPVPLQYVSPSQINAQLPFEVPIGAPVSLAVTNAGQRSNLVTVNALPAAPGVFTSVGNRAIVQNQNGSVNSSNSPARPGEILVAYLTGGGAVNASGPLISGGPSPNGASPVTSSYTVTVGGQQAQAFYFGLTPGFVGLYQINFQAPQLAQGSHPLVVNMGVVASNGPLVSIAP